MRIGSMDKNKIDDSIYDLYDEYCHGRINRRQFFERAASVAVTGVAMANCPAAELRRSSGSVIHRRAHQRYLGGLCI